MLFILIIQYLWIWEITTSFALAGVSKIKHDTKTADLALHFLAVSQWVFHAAGSNWTCLFVCFFTFLRWAELRWSEDKWLNPWQFSVEVESHQELLNSTTFSNILKVNITDEERNRLSVKFCHVGCALVYVSVSPADPQATKLLSCCRTHGRPTFIFGILHFIFFQRKSRQLKVKAC